MMSTIEGHTIQQIFESPMDREKSRFQDNLAQYEKLLDRLEGALYSNLKEGGCGNNDPESPTRKLSTILEFYNADFEQFNKKLETIIEDINKEFGKIKPLAKEDTILSGTLQTTGAVTQK